MATNVALVPTTKANPAASLNPTRLIVHYLLQCVKHGNPEAAALLLQDKVKENLLEEDHAMLREGLMVIIRQVAQQNFQGNTTNVVKAADLFLNHYSM